MIYCENIYQILIQNIDCYMLKKHVNQIEIHIIQILIPIQLYNVGCIFILYG